MFGGLRSGVTENTRNIFLESAWFNPVDIRKTSFRHNLRTEAAARFEKNVDISNTVNVLKRAALLIKEIAGGEIASEIVDIYPNPKEKQQVTMKFHYLKRLSGKNYHPDTIKKILQSLGFEIDKEGIDDLRVNVPFSKPDISLPADVVEEIMRIDGLDNIDIPTSILISPSTEKDSYKQVYKEKIANMLAGTGFHEIFTNSITNSAYFPEQDLEHAVRLLNNLSAVHNIMRPSMLETGLEAIAYNLNRRNSDLSFFEFGKTYSSREVGKYEEKEHLCLYITGSTGKNSWKEKSKPADIYYLKGILANVLRQLGIANAKFNHSTSAKLSASLEISSGNITLGQCGIVSQEELNRFDIRQPVFFADLHWDIILAQLAKVKTRFEELPRQLPVYRDLAMIVPNSLEYGLVEKTIQDARISKLRSIELFDIFQSEKLGTDKKSLALSFTFLDEEKTLTDKEIDGLINRIMTVLEKDLQAEIRK